MADLQELVTKFGGYQGGSGVGYLQPQRTLPSGAPGTKEVRPSQNIVQKAGAVIGETAHIAGQIGKAVGKYTWNTLVDVNQAGEGSKDTVTDLLTYPIRVYRNEQNSKQLRANLDAVTRDYNAGKISKTDYQRYLKEIRESMYNINQDANQIATSKSASEREGEIVETAANILTVGKGTTLEAGGKEIATIGVKDAFKQGVETGVDNLFKKTAVTLENAVTKIPAVRDVVERNAATLIKDQAARVAGESFDQMIKRQSKDIAVGLLIKRPIFYQSNIESTQNIYDSLQNGKYGSAVGSAAWLATQMLSGGPLGAFAKGLGSAKRAVGKLAYGKGSFIDELSKRIGDGNANQVARFIATAQKRAPNEAKDIERVFRILQETNLRSADENLAMSVDNVLSHYTEHGIDTKDLTPSQLYKDMKNWADADEIMQQTIRSGLIKDIHPEDAHKYVVVRWDTPTKNALAKEIIGAGDDKVAMWQAVHKLADKPGVGWGNNEILMNKIEKIISSSRTAQEAADEIKNISTASTIVSDVPGRISQKLAKLGYSIAAPFGGRKTPIVTYDDTRKLITSAIKGTDNIFDEATAAQPQLAAMASFADRMGLSPRAANTVASSKLSETLVSVLDDTKIGKQLGIAEIQGGEMTNGGRALLSKLQDYIENKRALLNLGRSAAITDVRQLRVGEIADALGVSKATAKEVSRSLMTAYTQVPLEIRGLGDRVVDELYKYNPLHKYYSRIQAAMRYTYNPFFRVQERVETGILSRATGHKLIWGVPTGALDDAVKQLDQGGIFSSSLPGEAANDQVFGRITANITHGQKKDLAGLALTLAKNQGVGLQEMINDHPDQLDDALRVIVQYGRKGSLNSPLARTINLAFFPMRYNLKVAGIVAKELIKLPPSVQLATIKGIFDMKDWLKSDEGIKWQAEHQDAIQVFKWLTPYNSIEYVMNLFGHKPDSVGELGILGGLPLGFISQMLDSQGIIHLNTPYVNLSKGEVVPDYVPKSAQARVSVALTDLLGSMFTYPGRILGLPGKEATLRNIVKSFIATNGTDFDKNYDTERLTPLQKQWIKVLKGDTSQEAIDKLYTSPAPESYQGYTLPPLSLPPITPVLSRTEVAQRNASNSTGTRTKKKALPIPPR